MTNNTKTASTTDNLVTRLVHANYFSRLNAFGNNVDGTCTVIAAAILFGYYDLYVDDLYVSARYMTDATPSSNVGTTEEFHQLLCEFVYEDEPRGGIFIRDAALGFTGYLIDRQLGLTFQANSTHSVSATRTKVIEIIDNNRPLIASMGTSHGANINHTVVVYGYQYSSSSNTMFQTHYGWLNSPSYYNTLVSSAWFYAYGYIPE